MVSRLRGTSHRLGSCRHAHTSATASGIARASFELCACAAKGRGKQSSTARRQKFFLRGSCLSRGAGGRGAGRRGAGGRGAGGRGAGGQDADGRGADGQDADGRGADERDADRRSANERHVDETIKLII